MYDRTLFFSIVQLFDVSKFLERTFSTNVHQFPSNLSQHVSPSLCHSHDSQFSVYHEAYENAAKQVTTAAPFLGEGDRVKSLI